MFKHLSSCQIVVTTDDSYHSRYIQKTKKTKNFNLQLDIINNGK